MLHINRFRGTSDVTARPLKLVGLDHTFALYLTLDEALARHSGHLTEPITRLCALSAYPHPPRDVPRARSGPATFLEIAGRFIGCRQED